ADATSRGRLSQPLRHGVTAAGEASRLPGGSAGSLHGCTAYASASVVIRAGRTVFGLAFAAGSLVSSTLFPHPEGGHAVLQAAFVRRRWVHLAPAAKFALE